MLGVVGEMRLGGDEVALERGRGGVRQVIGDHFLPQRLDLRPLTREIQTVNHGGPNAKLAPPANTGLSTKPCLQLQQNRQSLPNRNGLTPRSLRLQPRNSAADEIEPG